MRAIAPGDQLFVNQYLDRAMGEFDRNRLAVTLMRRLATEFPDEFTTSAMRYLDTSDESNAHRVLATMMLHQPSVFSQMADPALRSKPRAARLLRRFLRIDPSFDVQFARHLPDRTGTNHSTALDSVRSERALDILDETSRGRRLLPIIGHLPNSHNARISARAVLFIGRRVQSPAWVEKQLLERPDPRARANAVEGIWGLDSPAAKDLLEMCTDDTCNRVVGNALIGLSIAGKPGVAGELRRLGLRPQDPFRGTAAWAMGRLGDPAFLDSLQLLVRDDSPTVRGAALRAMIEIRRIETEAAAEPSAASPGSLEHAAQVIDIKPVVPVVDLRLDGRSFAYTRDNIDKLS